MAAPTDGVGQPRNGAIKITKLKPIRFRGTDYILAQGKPSKTKVTVGVGCKDTRTGAWRWERNRLVPETVSKCASFKKKTVDVRYERVMVPKALAGALKKGKWARFHTTGGVSVSKHNVGDYTPKLDLKKDLGASSKSTGGYQVGVPICIASKSTKCSPGRIDTTKDKLLLK